MKAASSLIGTEYLPSLEGKFWLNEEKPEDSLDQAQRLIIKRSKLGVQIIKKESDIDTKFELFQRLNTGGTALSLQEIRNCILVMINKDFYTWLSDLSKNVNYNETIPLSDRAKEEQYNLELTLRYLVYKNLEVSDLNDNKDIGKLLTDKMIIYASDKDFNYSEETHLFEKIFKLLDLALGEDCFRKWDNSKEKFTGAFSISAFEIIITGLSKHINSYDESPESIAKLKSKIISISNNPAFVENSGNGKRASTRLPHLIPLGIEIFAI